MKPDPQFARDDDPEFDPVMDTVRDPQFNVHRADRITPLDFPDDHLTQLGLALDFGPPDLAANRAGWLTEAQIARLESDLRWFYWPVIIALALIAFVIGAGSAAAGTLTVMPFVLLALAAIPAVLLKLERERLPDREVKADRLRIGRISMVMRRLGSADDTGPMRSVKLPVDGGKPISGPKILYKYLQPNHTYIVYYTPVWTWRGYRLLSLEPADAEKAKSPPRRKVKDKWG